MALVPIALLRRRVGFGSLGLNFTLVLIGNLIGSIFVAYFLAVKAGVIGSAGVDPSTPAGMTFERLAAIAKLKGDTEGADQIFLRALGCNWLVCLAVWVAMTAEDTGGKILGIFFPIMAFVAIGFDHVVANMFFLPAAIFAHVPNISWGDALYNWVFAFLGNLVGAAVFVSTAYWFLHLRGTEDAAPSQGEPATATAGNGNGRFAREQPTTAERR
jgi:formate/nitrite transporter